MHTSVATEIRFGIPTFSDPQKLVVEFEGWYAAQGQLVIFSACARHCVFEAGHLVMALKIRLTASRSFEHVSVFGPHACDSALRQAATPAYYHR